MVMIACSVKIIILWAVTAPINIKASLIPFFPCIPHNTIWFVTDVLP